MNSPRSPLRRARAALPAAVLVTGLAAGDALADTPVCAEAPDDSWMQPEAVQERAETLGYTIENMVVSDGNCYELSGLNVRGERVTTYLDPRTADIVREDIVR